MLDIRIELRAELPGMVHWEREVIVGGPEGGANQ